MLNSSENGLSKLYNTSILINREYAFLDINTLNELEEYSISKPKEVKDGKMWKTFFDFDENGERWLLNWYVYIPETNLFVTDKRIIKIKREPKKIIVSSEELFFQKNGFFIEDNFLKHDKLSLLNVTIKQSENIFEIGYIHNNKTFYQIGKNIKTVKELQQILFLLCGLKTNM